MLKAQRIDATKGSLVRMIILYTVPLILSTLIQTLFNAVDIVVLGNMADSSAVASVGATTSIIHLVVNTFIGLSNGTKVILARQIGAKDRDQTQKTVNTSLICAVVLGVIITVLGLLFAPDFLRMTDCPEDCFKGAVIYIRIYVCAAPAILLYNFGSAVLSASGDTKRPLYYIVACGLLNVVLNIILCFILPQKVAAVAIATAVSQILGAVLVISRLCRMDGIGKVVISKIRWNAHAFGLIMQYGLPIALSQGLYPLANLQIQSAVNSYGVSAVAGNSAASTIESFASAFTGAFGSTTTTFMGQNLGANKPERVKGSFYHCLWMGVSAGLVLGVFLYVTARFWLGFILTDDVEAVEYALIRMFYILGFYFVSALNSIFSHAIQAYGYSLFCTLNSIACVFGFRMVWMRFIYPQYQNFDVLMACYLISWLLLLVVYFIGFSVIYYRYKKGKYKQI